MRIIVEERVDQAIDAFYDASILSHWHTLSYETVERKKNRLYDGLESLADYATIFPKARLKQDWIENDWQEYICEDFHFAYEITLDVCGEMVIVVHDAVHSLNYRQHVFYLFIISAQGRSLLNDNEQLTYYADDRTDTPHDAARGAADLHVRRHVVARLD